MSQTFSRSRIVVLGYIVRGPLGGLVWHHLQYVLGLTRMGYDVLFIEESGDYASCYDPGRQEMTTNPDYGLRFISQLFEYFGLAGHWAYHDEHASTWFGKSIHEIDQFCRTAELLINVSGVNNPGTYALNIPIRIFIDTDPVFTQVRNLENAQARELTLWHNRFFTFAENIGQESCTIPEDGLKWLPTRQPVVMDEWALTPGNPDGPWTTVMQWDSYRSVEHQSVRFGMKSSSFGTFMDLPMLSQEIFELAIGSETTPKKTLHSHGWKLADPLEVTKTPSSYQSFIRNSKAEWSVAKHGYVISRSGWFSERSACYLASGRPVLVQDTGFSAHLETGRGLLCFSDLQQCLNGIESVNAEYGQHCRWAREIVAAHFDHRKVLIDLLQDAL